ncbi:amino acid ABC transporter permease [Tessaracoccus antarcticus]|uniref:Amino acid ABC transporter permease n=1 Tax=Tessaracoccus antarcticus TaxID=2479848 RepID=A0A3M0GXG9_9ACTN|nr:amino acid ABC transporter permease [Tessaracoccus antarcticus]RMB62066.1 amino acid ABC transporter permease [Tessaracoccus antarcticus]
MSGGLVLYDVPGPRARRRQVILAIVVGLAAAGLIALVLHRLNAQGQFEAKLWDPLVNPSDKNFAAVWGLIGDGFVNTMKAAALAIAFSLSLGTVIGVARLMLGRWTRIPLVGFIELFRGLPVVISIFFASRVLPDLGVDLSGWPGGEGLWFVVIGLTAYNSVILAEILRSGVNALPKGQSEAAVAIGLSRLQTMGIILLPQAVRIMLPALISQLVVILKDTSLAAVLGVYPEMLNAAKYIYLNLDNPIQALFVVGTIFVVINFALSKLAGWVERRLSRSKRSPGQDTDDEVRYITDTAELAQ